MKQKSLKANFLYNIFYQILTIIIPFITTPYIARVIGPKGAGINSYTYSVVSYFLLFANLGISNYGNRLIAKNRDNEDKLSKSFSSLFKIHIITTAIMLIIYIFYVMIFGANYKLFYLCQSLYLISALVDISWLFFGLEEFKIITIRNTIIKLILTCCIFIFVRSYDDLYIYILLLSGSGLLSQILLFPFFKKLNIKICKTNFKDLKKHIKPLLILFIPIIALSIYKLMDKIMLGGMTTITEVGFYEYAERIINLPMTIITALGTVMLPRMSNLASKNDDKKFIEYINKSMKVILFLSIPLCFGIIIVSPIFVPIFLGNAYKKTSYITTILALTIPFIACANVIRTQYLIPKENDKDFIISLILGAIVNLFLNLIFIPKYSSIGAAIATLIAEIAVMLYQVIKVKNVLNIKLYVEDAFSFFLKAIIMSIVIYIISLFNFNRIIKLITMVLFGIGIYFLMNYKYITTVVNIKKILKGNFKKR